MTTFLVIIPPNHTKLYVTTNLIPYANSRSFLYVEAIQKHIQNY